MPHRSNEKIRKYMTVVKIFEFASKPEEPGFPTSICCHRTNITFIAYFLGCPSLAVSNSKESCTYSKQIEPENLGCSALKVSQMKIMKSRFQTPLNFGMVRNDFNEFLYWKGFVIRTERYMKLFSNFQMILHLASITKGAILEGCGQRLAVSRSREQI